MSPETARRVDILFPAEEREKAVRLLHDRCGNNLPFLDKSDMYELERFRFAALKYSDGRIDLLEGAVELAEEDWRDLLMAMDFSNDVNAHRSWEPKPVGEPAVIDPAPLRESVHRRLEALLEPLGFRREGDRWSLENEVRRSLTLNTGLTSRTETRFFVRVGLETKAESVFLQLPRTRLDTFEQGYAFRAGDSEDALLARIEDDVVRQALPWFRRFTSAAELRRGFEDKTFHPAIDIEGQTVMF